MSKRKELRENRVQWVCPRCQSIYYEMKHGEFDADRIGATKEANRIKRTTHRCWGRK